MPSSRSGLALATTADRRPLLLAAALAAWVWLLPPLLAGNLGSGASAWAFFSVLFVGHLALWFGLGWLAATGLTAAGRPGGTAAVGLLVLVLTWALLPRLATPGVVLGAAAVVCAWLAGVGRHSRTRPAWGDLAIGLLGALPWQVRALQGQPPLEAALLGGVHLCLWSGLAWLVRAAGLPGTWVRGAVLLMASLALLLLRARAGAVPVVVAEAAIGGGLALLGLLASGSLGRAFRVWPVPRVLLANLVAAIVVLGGLEAFRMRESREAVSLPAPARSGAHRIVLLAIDGLDPDLLQQLIDRGLLPTLGRLAAEGVVAPLTTVSALSPVVWTTIATGTSPELHGVRDFLTPYLRGTGRPLPRLPADPLLALASRAGVVEYRPVSSNDRRTRALWEVATLGGQPSLFVNWWASYPAEQVDGIQISNHALPWSGFRDADLERVARLDGMVSPASLWPDVLAAIRELRGEEVKAGIELVAGIRLTAEDLSYFAVRDRIALGLFRRFSRPEARLSSVYLEQIDTAGHVWSQSAFEIPAEPWKDRRPRQPRLSREAAARSFDEVVVAAYRNVDGLLREVVDGLAPDQSLVVVSDHGWEFDGHEHYEVPAGILLLHGPLFARGVRLPAAHVYDVFPTVAAGLGLPISRELPGTVLAGAMSGAQPPTRMAKTYGQRSASIQVQGEADAGHIERLRALGYVQ